MYVVRLYKDYDTNKNLGVKIVDERTMQFREIDWDTLVKTVKQNANSIANVEIDKYGRVRLKNLSPGHNIRYYNQHHVDNLVINQYCIIIASNVGRISFIADSPDGIHYGVDVTIGDMAATLGVEDIGKLKLYNAYIEVGVTDYEIFMFRGDCYRKLGKLAIESTDELISDDWEYKVLSVGQDGLRLESLESVEDVKEATVPDGISYIENFLGGVNILTIPIGVKELGVGCFEDLDDLYAINIGKGVTEIPDDCFRYSAIQYVEFSGYEERIGEYAFEGTILKGSIVTGAKKIGRYAFSHTHITSLVTTRANEIGVCAFEGCSNLARIRLDDSLVIIQGGAFKYCTKLKEVLIPKNVKHIGKHAFKDCSSLRIAKIPANCKIGEDAFPRKCQIIRY